MTHVLSKDGKDSPFAPCHHTISDVLSKDGKDSPARA